jgi:hypothetical protein
VATQRVTIGVEVDGLKETLRAFNKYGKEANKELREAAQAEVSKIAPALVAAGRRSGAQSALVATTVKAPRDRVPVIAAGGAKRVAPSRKRRRKPSAGDVFFGAEFGGRGRPTTQQFRPHTGTRGYWFYPTLRRKIPALLDGYQDALDRLCEKWDGMR